jgi:hypothetical protein
MAMARVSSFSSASWVVKVDGDPAGGEFDPSRKILQRLIHDSLGRGASVLSHKSVE